MSGAMSKTKIFVQKRNNRGLEEIKFDKITIRINALSNMSFDEKPLDINPTLIALDTIKSIHNMIHTSELDEISAKVAESFISIHPDYTKIAARILISNLHKTTPPTFSECMKKIYENTEEISDEAYEYIMANADVLNSMIVHDRDYDYEYQSVRSLINTYLKRIEIMSENATSSSEEDVQKPSVYYTYDRPQYLYMREAIAMYSVSFELSKETHHNDLHFIKQTYDDLSLKKYTHATPTLSNALKPHQQLASCFVAGTKVFTITRGVQNIEDVVIGDVVRTHLGNHKKVLQLHTNYLGDRELLCLQVANTPDIIVTENHRVFAIHDRKSEPEWIATGNLNESYCVAIPSAVPHTNVYDTEDNDLYSGSTTTNERDFMEFKLSSVLVAHIHNTGEYRYSSEIANTLVSLTCTIRNKHRSIIEDSLKHNGVEYEIIEMSDATQFLRLAITDKSYLNKIMLQYGDRFDPRIPLQHNRTEILDYLATVIKVPGQLEQTIFHMCRHNGIVDKYDSVPDRVVGDKIYLRVRHTPNAAAQYQSIQHVYNPSTSLQKVYNPSTSLQKVYNPSTSLQKVYTLGVEDDHSYNVEGIVVENCFLMGTEDSRAGIMKTVDDSSSISKYAGGNGIHMSNIRPSGSRIMSTGGKSSGLPGQLPMYDAVSVAFDQGGKRPGAIAIYVEPWHADIMDFLAMKLHQGDYNLRNRNLFYGLWIPDLFMKRFNENKKITLFGEDLAPGLSSVYDGMDVCKHCFHCHNPEYRKHFVNGKPRQGLLRRGKAKQTPDSKCNYDCVKTTKFNTTTQQMQTTYEHAGCDMVNCSNLQLTDDGLQSCNHEYEQVDVFTQLYEFYESKRRGVGRIFATKIVDALCEALRDVGVPYCCFKDHVNRQSNHKYLGTIKSSNLCTEIMEWSSSTEYATCILASVALPKFVKRLPDCNQSGTGDTSLTFDFADLHETVKRLTRNLNRVIDVNKYPVDNCVEYAKAYRPLGIGIQGLSNVFQMLRIPFVTKQAAELDFAIVETMYHAFLEASSELVSVYGQYKGYANSPLAEGLLHFDMWKQNRMYCKTDTNLFDTRSELTPTYDWEAMRQIARTTGFANTLGIALMPTVGSSVVLGNSESFEPLESNLLSKNTQNSTYTFMNHIMVRHLIELGYWNAKMYNDLINAKGSLAGFTFIPQEIRDIYKTVREIKQVDLISRASIRGAFVDQAQSLNIYLNDNTNRTFKGVLKLGWELGLKTGSYYTKTGVAVVAQNNVAVTKQEKNTDVFSGSTKSYCTREMMEAGCTSCSS